ncbi:H-NS histone family protein [Comamonas sp. C24C]
MPTSAVSYKDLLAQRATLEAKIEAARKSEIGAAVQQIKSLISTYGLTQDDIFPQGKTKATRATVDPKYRDPATGQTWTGRGKPPTWIKDQDRSQFEIK